MIDQIKNFTEIGKNVLKTKINIPKNYRKVKNIIISGVGASAISGDIVHDCLNSKIPILVSRSYELPSFANRDTLVICISNSGNTKPTLAQFYEAKKRKCKIVGITANGRLEKEFKKSRFPYYKIPVKLLSRVALPYMLFSLVKIFQELGFEFDFSLNDLERKRKLIEKDAKKLSKKIENTIPIVCGVYESACMRFKSQLNENAKVITKCEILPEMNHNEIESWENLNKKFSVIMLREGKERREIKIIIKTIRKLIIGKTNYFEIFAKGKSKFDVILYQVLFGDFVSYFLAKQKHVGMYKTKFINAIKKALTYPVKRGKPS